MIVLNSRILGKNQNVLKMQVQDGYGTRMEALYFGDIPKILAYFEERKGAKVAFTYYPTISEYQGNKNLQIIVQNYR